MKAWTIRSTDNEGPCRIVFADNQTRARRQALGSCPFEDSEYTSLRATRAPGFDGREGNPPAIRELVTLCGWHTTCAKCREEIDANQVGAWKSDVATCWGCVLHEAESIGGGA